MISGRNIMCEGTLTIILVINSSTRDRYVDVVEPNDRCQHANLRKATTRLHLFQKLPEDRGSKII